MNRARQDSITTEIMEIVSGAEALGGGTKTVHHIDLDLSFGMAGVAAGTREEL